MCLIGSYGCSSETGSSRELVLATTTSTQDSGLLDALIPLFKRESGVQVKVVAVGSGQALELGRRGDADVLLTHAPQAEKAFVANGYGRDRQTVMHNEFVIVGPPSDAGQLKGLSIQEVFRTIARKQISFVSRGDGSGTHLKEQAIWSACGISPQGSWYMEAAGGMGQTLRIANEKRSWTLTDRGTFLAQGDTVDLAILSEGDPLLLNEYSVILLSEEKHPELRHTLAKQFAEFLLSAKAQNVIESFGRERYGEPLFRPNNAVREAH